MDDRKTRPEILVGVQVRIVDVNPVRARPVAEERNRIGRNPAAHQLMGMTDLHGQQQIAGLVGVIREVGCAVFGEAGAHVRSAVGVSVLPLDAPVEVELVVEA